VKRKTIGVALGAGSTQGFAPIGVLQALSEQKIPIDMISGCSMGAIVGAIYATGGDMSALKQYLEDFNLRNYLDIGLGQGGLLRGKRLQELVKSFTQDRDFSETEIPFVCVAVDLESGTLKTFDSGKLHEAVRASMSMPAFFQPARINGKIYVDGAVLDRVPTKALRDRGMDIVIGVDIGYRGEETDASSMNVYQLLGHTISIMQWELSKRSHMHADVMIVPPVREYVKEYFQMNMLEKTIEDGRCAALAAVPDIRRLMKKRRSWRSFIQLRRR
jgi:NTE family protein